VLHLCSTFNVSQRRACRVLDQPRATQRLRPRERPGEKRLVQRMLELVGLHPRFGYRRVWALLRAEGWRVNRKRVYRLWRQQGLKVPRRKRKKRRLGHKENGCCRRRALARNHVWAWDFIHDRTADGRPLKWLTVVDEYTRECVALEVARSMRASRVIEILAERVRERGAPLHVRSDNGPEFIAAAIRRWLAEAGVDALYIEPGAPWENGYAESFNSKLRDELLDREEFGSPLEARVLSASWREDYDQRRPHSSLGYQTPAAFARSCPDARSLGLRADGPEGGSGEGGEAVSGG
jgi:transposase InsO family protein